MNDDPQQADPLEVEARLRALDSLPVDEHVAIYDALHRELRDQLVGGTAGREAADQADAPGGSEGPDGAPSPGS